MGRPIGNRIVEVLEIAERLGPCSVRQGHACMSPEVDIHNADKYFTRAVGMGLMTVDRCGKPKLYYVAPGWRKMLLALRAEPKPVPAVPVVAAELLPLALQARHPLETVWANFG